MKDQFQIKMTIQCTVILTNQRQIVAVTISSTGYSHLNLKRVGLAKNIIVKGMKQRTISMRLNISCLKIDIFISFLNFELHLKYAHRLLTMFFHVKCFLSTLSISISVMSLSVKFFCKYIDYQSFLVQSIFVMARKQRNTTATYMAMTISISFISPSQRIISTNIRIRASLNIVLRIMFMQYRKYWILGSRFIIWLLNVFTFVFVGIVQFAFNLSPSYSNFQYMDWLRERVFVGRAIWL